MFRMESSSVRPGERLSVGLEFPPGAPWLKDVARVELRLQCQVEYRLVDGGRAHWTLPGTKALREGPLAGPRLPFHLEVPPGLLPSLAGKDFHFAWELVASVHGPSGKVLHQETRPLRLLPGPARQLPVPREPPPPREKSPLGRLASRAALLLPVLCFGGPGLVALWWGFAMQEMEMMLPSLMLLGFGYWATRWVYRASREYLLVKLCRLEPLAESVPLGATARLRLFLELTEPLTVTSTHLVLRGELCCDDRWRPLLVQKVRAALQGPLAAGRHQLDLELPIPREFVPSYPKLLRSTCELTLASAQNSGVRTTCVLTIAPEVLEAPGALGAG